MDRREFLLTTGAAVAATGAVQPATAADLPAPSLAKGLIELRVALSWPDDVTGAGDSARRLALRIGTATGGRLRLVMAPGGPTGIDAIASGEADLYHGSEHDNLHHARAFAYFAGLPARLGLPAQQMASWLEAGGGQTLWDDLLAEFGVKALLAGHTGRGRLWSTRPLDGLAEFSGHKVYAPGLGGDVVRAVGGEAVDLRPGEIAGALASGRLDAADAGGLVHAMALGLPRVARSCAAFAINTTGTALSLGVSRRVWDGLGAEDRAIVATCAAAEFQTSIAEIMAHERMARHALANHHGVRFAAMPSALAEAVARVAEAVVAHAGSAGQKAAAINASYMGYRELVLPAADAAERDGLVS